MPSFAPKSLTVVPSDFFAFTCCICQSTGLHVLLDVFHAMQRISKLLLKSHGACAAYLARLRDACFEVHKGDLAKLEAALAAQGMSPAEIEEKKKKNWGYILQRCRR